MVVKLVVEYNEDIDEEKLSKIALFEHENEYVITQFLLSWV